MCDVNLDRTTEQVIGAAIEVHRWLGPGLLESVYEECLAREMDLRRMPFERQKPVPLAYKGHSLGADFRLDFVVNSEVIVELKAVDALQPIHDAQVLTYLRLTGLPVALLINFNSALLKDGVRRFVMTGRG